MLKRLSIYVTPNHASFEIDTDSFSRTTSSPNIESAIKGLPSEDRAVLRSFCAQLLTALDQSKQLGNAAGSQQQKQGNL